MDRADRAPGHRQGPHILAPGPGSGGGNRPPRRQADPGAPPLPRGAPKGRHNCHFQPAAGESDSESGSRLRFLQKRPRGARGDVTTRVVGGGACSGNLHMNGDPASRGQFSGKNQPLLAGSQEPARAAGSQDPAMHGWVCLRDPACGASSAAWLRTSLWAASVARNQPARQVLQTQPCWAGFQTENQDC